MQGLLPTEKFFMPRQGPALDLGPWNAPQSVENVSWQGFRQGDWLSPVLSGIKHILQAMLTSHKVSIIN